MEPLSEQAFTKTIAPHMICIYNPNHKLMSRLLTIKYGKKGVS